MAPKPSVELLFSPEFLAAIGDVITRWAYAEVELDQALQFLRHAPEARALSDDIPRPFRKRIKLFSDSAALCFGSCPPLAARAANLTNDLRSLYKLRNFLAHGRWRFSNQDDIECNLLSDGSWVKIEVMTFNLEEIRGLATRIGEASASLFILKESGNHWTLSEVERDALREFRDSNISPPRSPLFP